MPVFPPARFQALQLLQSEPAQPPTVIGSLALDAGLQAQELIASHSPLATSHRSSDLGLRTSDSSASHSPLTTSHFPSDLGLSFVELARAEIALRTGQPADAAISSARHAACLTLFESVAHVARPKADWREKVDRLAMHPIWGYAVLMGVFLGFFRLIFDVGKLGEDRILNVFDFLVAALAGHMNPQGALFAASKGAVLGTAGAVAIVLPYLLPFLLGLAILEDIGYLSRVGYLMDAAMHRLGLHGTATLPILVGYGCSVPAVMATRILSTRRDRFIAAFLAVLVPCSARMTVIFALVGFYLGANYALGIYALNIIVVALSGHVLARMWPEISPGMLMEVPAYRVPAPRVVALKTWWRLREFVLVAFPLLVVGSVLLSLVDFYGWQHGINAALSPLTALLGLPRSVGLTLIFGVLRKELSLLMLMQALGTTHVLGVMTAAQILIFTLFVTFYLPCMATLASMMRELGWRLTLAASGALLTLAIVVSLVARGVLRLL
jgi:ferrous iron transport protein B